MDELDDKERDALDAWSPLTPPSGFADRVLAAREAPAPRRARWPRVAGAVAACAAAAALVVMLRAPDHEDQGRLVAETRTTRTLGGRAVAVAEPRAALAWTVDDDGDAVIEQTAGDVFYRVDRGGTFVVHTPAGDVHVTGTCFRIEVDMNKKVLASGALGAAIASAVVITVYEGRVVADNRGTKAEVTAGNQALLTPDGRTSVASIGSKPDAVAIAATAASGEEKQMTREQLLARTATQRTHIAKLEARVAELERVAGGRHDNGAEEGRRWHDPSDERLKAWAAECHVRGDEPGFDMWRPSTALGRNPRGLEPDELAHYNAALTEVQGPWKAVVRALYIEATGDVQGADSLSLDAMRNEIQQKGSPEEHSYVLQRIANERAGYAQPPADLTKLSPYERLMRAWLELGDQTEAALAKRVGPERAAEIRGDGWDSRSDWSGCPDTGE